MPTSKVSNTLILLICLQTAACSVFETREPELPGRGDGSAFIQPDQPRNVIDNLKNAVASLNQSNYLRCLSDEVFQYTPTPQAQNTDPDLWAAWSKHDEEVYFNNMRAASENFSGHQLQLQNETFDIDTENTQQYTAEYTLTMVHNRSSGATDVPTVATGTIRLTLKSGEDGLWSIQEWVDAPDSDSFTWSDMRATFIR